MIHTHGTTTGTDGTLHMEAAGTPTGAILGTVPCTRGTAQAGDGTGNTDGTDTTTGDGAGTIRSMTHGVDMYTGLHTIRDTGPAIGLYTVRYTNRAIIPDTVPGQGHTTEGMYITASATALLPTGKPTEATPLPEGLMLQEDRIPEVLPADPPMLRK